MTAVAESLSLSLTDTGFERKERQNSPPVRAAEDQWPEAAGEQESESHDEREREMRPDARSHASRVRDRGKGHAGCERRSHQVVGAESSPTNRVTCIAIRCNLTHPTPV